jgi:hypothetical protein
MIAGTSQTELVMPSISHMVRAISVWWGNTVMMRKWNLVLAMAAVLACMTPAHSLSPQDRVGDWARAANEDRLKVARILSLVASQGLDAFNEAFFERCISIASIQPSLHTRTIGTVASSCVNNQLLVQSRREPNRNFIWGD